MAGTEGRKVEIADVESVFGKNTEGAEMERA